MNKRALKCLRCNAEMEYVMTERIQLGQTGWILGDIPNLIAGSMEVDIYSCHDCGKIEFFQAENTTNDSEELSIAQKKCPKCGNSHDIDYPKCPFCKYDYNS